MKKPSEKPFHFAGGIEFAENTSARLARNRAASIFSGAGETAFFCHVYRDGRD